MNILRMVIENEQCILATQDVGNQITFFFMLTVDLRSKPT